MAKFSGDLSIKLIDGGAEVTMVDGDPLSDSGIENGIFASIFGAKDYFGNGWSQNPDEHFKSEFLAAAELPITIENLKQMSKAATLDLSWMVRQGQEHDYW